MVDTYRVKNEKDPAKGKELRDKLKRCEELLWPGASPQGKPLYSKFQAGCPMPIDFTEPKFWTGDTDQKIIDAIKACQAKFNDDEIKALTVYIKKTFGRYVVYKIIDGNQQPRSSDPYCEKIVLQTRSILQVFIYLANFIKVPDEHLPNAQNRASKNILYGQSLNGAVTDQIIFKIKSSKERPKDAFVAVKRENYWFYIDDKDFDSKNVFSSIAGILSMSEPGTKEGTPVLTLPVQ